MGKRKGSIRALVKRSEADIRKIEKEYTDSLHTQKIQPEIQVHIKNFCENLRSVLDYLAHDVREIYCASANPKARFYFPIFPTKDDFMARTNEWYPGLDSNASDLWNFLESIQPYHHLYRWLGAFNKVNNENKHGDLVAQTRVETEQVSVSFVDGNVRWIPRDVQFGSGVSIGGVPVDPQTQMPVPHPSQKVERKIWVDFRFDGEDFSALGLLKEALEGIKSIANTVEKWL